MVCMRRRVVPRVTSCGPPLAPASRCHVVFSSCHAWHHVRHPSRRRPLQMAVLGTFIAGAVQLATSEAPFPIPSPDLL